LKEKLMESIKRAIFLCLGVWLIVLAAPDALAQQPTGEANKTQKSELTEGSKQTKVATMWKLIKSGGLMMVPLALLALYGCYKGGEQVYFVIFSNERAKDDALVKRLDTSVTALEEFEGVIEDEKIERQRAAFPPMCEAAMKRFREGKAAMEEALEVEGALQLGRLKRGIKPLQAVVMVAPLLGLLGTVYGMIASFQSISLNSGGNVKQDLSSGIYEALVTTATGLTIAIPFLFLYLWLNRRADQVGENINRQARQFLRALPLKTGRSAEEQEGNEASTAETQTI